MYLSFYILSFVVSLGSVNLILLVGLFVAAIKAVRNFGVGLAEHCKWFQLISLLLIVAMLCCFPSGLFHIKTAITNHINHTQSRQSYPIMSVIPSNHILECSLSSTFLLLLTTSRIIKSDVLYTLYTMYTMRSEVKCLYTQ